MENKLQIFENAEFGKISVIEKDGEPWFIGKEVADILGYSNTRDALAKHVDDDDKNTVAIRDGKGNPNKTIINESGLYSLIMSSKLPSAKRFKRWVTSEVLPAIRKTGSYSVKLSPNPKYRTRMIATAVKDMGNTAKAIEETFACKHGMALATAMTMVSQAYGFDPSPMRKLIPAEENPSYLTPKNIAEKLGITYKTGTPDGSKVNKALEAMGLQESKKSGKKSKWVLTTTGRDYGEAKAYDTGKHSDYQIMWLPKVLDLVKHYFSAENPDNVVSIEALRAKKEDA